VLAFSLAAALLASTPPLDEEYAARALEAVTSTDPLIAGGAFARALALIEHSADPRAERTLLKDVAARAKHPLVRAYAAFARAQWSARRDDVDAAMTAYAALGFVPAVRALGPFTNTGGAGFGTTPLSGPGSTDIAATQGTKVAALERDVAWQTVPLNPFGELNLGARIAPLRETRVLLALVIVSPSAMAAALRMGSGGQVRAALNGVEVLHHDVDRPLGFDQSVAGVRLQKGDNLLVIELGFLGDDGRAILRLTKPDGRPLAGVVTSTTSAAFARAATMKASALPAPSVASSSALPGTPLSLEQLRAASALEWLTRAGDRRVVPRAIESLLDELTRALDKLRAGRPDDARLAWEIGSVHARLALAVRERDVTLARMHLERALDVDPDNVEALLAFAELREAQDDDAQARMYYARAAAPGSDLAARSALRHARSQGHGGSATDLAILARAREVPTDGNLALAADVLNDRGDRAGAIALIEWSDVARASRLRFDIASAQLGRPDVDTAQLLEERVALARRALRTRPDSHGQAEQLALALVAAGRTNEARAFSAARAREIPERAEPLRLTARLALIDGDRDGARAQLAEALRLVPQNAQLASAVRALAGDDEELVQRYGLDPDGLVSELKQRGPPADAQRVGAHAMASTTAIRFFDNGLGSIVTDRMFQVHDAQKAAGLQTFAFPYSAGREHVEVLVAERMTKDGRHEPAVRIMDQGPAGKEGGVYTDVSQKVVVLGQLRDGDVIHIRARKELIGMQNLFGDFFGTLEPIQGFMPTQRWRLVVEAPKNRPLAWGGKNAPHPIVTEQGDRRVYDFKVEASPPLEAEPGMPPWLELADFASVSTYASWQALGAWYERLVAPQLVLDAELKRVARAAKEGAADDAQIARRLYEHVVTHTRYVGIELGIHGWQPYPVAEVHRRRYGDCKDKASLLAALLREAGVAANIALVRTVNVGHIDAEPASMWTFNHAIAYVPSLDLFLDGTAEASGWRETPTTDQGALALIVGKHGNTSASELVTIPVQRADANLNVSDYVLSLKPDGALDVRGTEKFRGSHNQEQRRDFADTATRRDRLEKYLADVMPGTHVRELDVSDLALAREDISYTFAATLPERASKQSDGSFSMALSLYPHDLTGNYAQLSARKTDVFVDHPWRTRNVMRYVLPAGFSAKDLPTGGTVKTEHLAFTQTITRTSDGFIVDEETAILERRIPVKDYARFRDAAIRADALMKRTIRITVGGTI
jgi:Tfp pilus assembly protein PilF